VVVAVAGLRLTPSAAEAAVVAAAVQPSSAAAAVKVLSSSAAAAVVLSFVEGLTSAAARTCACVPALKCGTGGAATAGVIVTAIADRASACTSEGAVAGVTDIIGAGA
jgi:hypothetical protein